MPALPSIRHHERVAPILSAMHQVCLQDLSLYFSLSLILPLGQFAVVER